MKGVPSDDERLNDDPKLYFPFLAWGDGYNKADPDMQINRCVAAVMLIFLFMYNSKYTASIGT